LLTRRPAGTLPVANRTLRLLRLNRTPRAADRAISTGTAAVRGRQPRPAVSSARSIGAEAPSIRARIGSLETASIDD
jgi:hypothetical protein